MKSTEKDTADRFHAGAPAEFVTLFRELVIAIQPRDLHRDTCRIYYETLQAFPLDVLRESAHRLRQRNNAFFPSAGEWFAVAGTVVQERREVLLTLPAARQEVCDRCDDTGWLPHECPGDATCGRTFRHLGHSYVTPCPCRATNPEYQRKHATRNEHRE